MLERCLNGISTGLNVIAGIALLSMTGLTCLDVVLRFLGHPILGTYEIVGLLGVLVNALALPQTTKKQGHVSVEVLVSHFSAKIRNKVLIFTYLMGSLLFGCISYAGWQYAKELKKGHEVSMTLQIPLYPFVLIISIAAFIVVLIMINEMIKSLTSKG